MDIKSRKIEMKVKKFTVAVFVAGIVFGAVGTTLVGGIFGDKEKGQKAEEPVKVVEVEKEATPRVEEKVVDSLEVAQHNAEKLASDDWELTLVNRFYPLAKSYAPEIVEVESGKYVDKRILADLQEMLADARKEGLQPFICSAYRDFEYQRQVFNDTMVTWIAQGYTPLESYEETAKSVAIPGTSEHATGLALDITSAAFAELDDRQADTPEAKWLAENCWKYGFILRYPLDKSDVTGIVFEPWHYRYVGKEYAKEITEKGLTLEEFVGKN